MADLDPQQLAALQAQVDANPEIQASRHGAVGFTRGKHLLRAMNQSGIRLPEGYEIDATSGQIVKSMGPGGFIKNAALTLGAPLAAGFLAPALAGVGGGTAATSGAEMAGMGSGGALGTAGGGGLLSTLGSLGKHAGDIGELFTGGGAGLANGRRADAQTNLQGTALNNRAQLESHAFNLQAPAARTQQVARGDVLATMQDAPATGDARIDKFNSGGLRPSAFGPDTRQAGETLKRQALQALLSGSDQVTPQMTQPSKAGTGEDLMSGLGLGAGLLGTLSKWRGW